MTKVTKVVRCRDLGFDCEGVVRAESTEEALRQVADHAKTVHKLDAVSDEIIAGVLAVMREEQES